MSNQVWTLGLTGGIACGKTAVANAFAQLGTTIIDADIAARAVVEPTGAAYHAIVAHFGSAILQADCSLDRRQLRQVVFSDPSQRLVLEKITHPAIRQRMVAQLQNCPTDYAILVIPLLVEHLATWQPLLARILVVDCAADVQLKRLMARDNISQSMAHNIIRAQTSSAARRKIADDIIDNSQLNPTQIHSRALLLHRQYLQLSQAARASI